MCKKDWTKITYKKVNLQLRFPIDFSIHTSIVDDNVQGSKNLKTFLKSFFQVALRCNINSHELNIFIAKFFLPNSTL